jgi:sugar-specific transcriptional regulator TrmB
MKFSRFIAHLTSAGLTEKEAKVYLACLEISPASVAGIAELAGVKRPTAYVILKGLSARGLVQPAEGTKKSHVCALHPERILELLHEEKRTAETRHREFTTVLPHMASAVAGSPKGSGKAKTKKD